MRAPDEISFDLDPDATGGGVVTLIVHTPAGEIKVMAEIVEFGRHVHVVGAPMGGPGANRLGVRGLAVVMRAFAEVLDVESAVVEGAARTSGARPLRQPLASRWRRRSRRLRALGDRS